MPKNDQQAETPSAGSQIETDDGESGLTETIALTPIMLDILELFEAGGEGGMHQDSVKQKMQNQHRSKHPKGYPAPPPIDAELSSLLGGLIEQVPHPKIKNEWVERQYRITPNGLEALRKLRPPAKS